MFRTLNRLLWGVAFVPLVAAALPAQQRPTPEQAQILLQTRPDLVAQLRERLRASGMTPDQVRARLRAEGYPDNLLDAYLQDGAAGEDAVPGSDVFDAIRALGISDSLALDSLRNLPLDSLEDMAVVRRFEEQELICREIPVDSLTPSDILADTLRRDTLFLEEPEERRDRLRRAREPRLVCRPRFGPDDAPPDSGMTIFGMELFERRRNVFDPNVSGPVDANYQLGPGDRLVLILTGDVEAAHTLDVTREGFVVIPQVGQIFVANLTLAQLEDVLYTRLGRVYSGIRRGGGTTRFSVSVARLRTVQVYVAGEVQRPGAYRVSGAGTALTALFAAGGPTDNGSLRRVEVRRGGELVGVLDVYDYLLRGDGSRDQRLQSGDVVFVTVHGPRVRVVGEVVRPATYEIAEGETLASIIQAAGGFKPTASRQRVHVERILPPELRGESGRERIELDVSGDSLATGSAARVAAGDVVRVLPISERVRRRITVTGNVWSPGAQGFTPGMRLSDAIARAGGPKPDVYLGRVLITRMRPDSMRVQLRAELRDTSGAPVEDIALQEDDEIRIFSVGEFRTQRYVSIGGAVRKSGRVPYREGMTMRDLVLLAGGLEEDAYLAEAEIARLPENRAGGVTATTVRVPLDSSYLFARGTNGDYVGPPGLPAASGSAPDIVLQPYDNVLIMRAPEFMLPRTVFVTGEVKYPGRYSLEKRTERLRDVIERAGGLTNTAYLDGVVFYRKQRATGRIGVDLRSVMRNERHRDNLILQDGDSVFLPTNSGVVHVQGAVNSPVGVAFVPGADLKFYIRAAGGPSARADMKRAYVTQPNGKVESMQVRPILPDGVPEPRPGSVVYVPERDPNAPAPNNTSLPVIAQILASLVTITAILVSR
jgi:protein involved in polysaccharide export with SLBB domain